MIDGYGVVEPIPNATFPLDIALQYRVVFDCRTAAEDGASVNPGLDRVARLLNLLEEGGVPTRTTQIAAVFHGASISAALGDDAHRRHFGADNPNTQLLGLLKGQGVELVVCGQSFVSHGFGLDEMDPRFTMAVSSLLALTVYQLRGFALLLE